MTPRALLSTSLALPLALASLTCTKVGPSVAPGSAPASPPLVPARPSDAALAPWMRAAFDPAPLRAYAWTITLDTHDEDGLVLEREGTVRCRADGPTRSELDEGRFALVSCQTCEVTFAREGDGLEHGLHECFFATRRGLWIVDAPPSDEQARQLIATEPYLRAEPEPTSARWTGEEDGVMFDASLEIATRALTVMGQPTTAWCRTDTDSRMYGSSTTRCFAEGFGVVSADMWGRSGPSTETYRLIEISPVPAR